MRVIFFGILFLASCSIRDKLLTDNSNPSTLNNSIHLKYDINNDGNVSQEELKKIKDQKKLHFEIEIDGGINSETALICKKNGADVLVAGSYIFSDKKENYKTRIDSLR